MGRLWLALALLIGFAAPAFAVRPHEPATPRIKTAYLEIGPQRTSTGLHDVTWLHLDAELDRYTTTVRITLRNANGEAFTVETTPDHLDLVRPNLFALVGTSRLIVTSISNTRLESLPAEIDVVAPLQNTTRCGNPLFLIGMVFGAVVGILLMLGVLFKMRATEAERARVRATIEPTALPQPAAEDHIRTVALRSLLAIIVVAAIVVASLGADMLFVPIYGSPLLLVIGITAIMRVINAGRAIALLHGPDARATTRHDQLEVTACDRHVTLRSSPSLVKRARSHALPRATL